MHTTPINRTVLGNFLNLMFVRFNRSNHASCVVSSNKWQLNEASSVCITLTDKITCKFQSNLFLVFVSFSSCCPSILIKIQLIEIIQLLSFYSMNWKPRSVKRENLWKFFYINLCRPLFACVNNTTRTIIPRTKRQTINTTAGVNCFKTIWSI